jgi:hypothetical protein
MNTIALPLLPMLPTPLATVSAAANTAAASGGLSLGGWATMLGATIGVTLFFAWCLVRALRAK